MEVADDGCGEGDQQAVLRRADTSNNDTSTGAESSGSAIVVSGTVTYRERSALPPGAIVIVRVADVSIPDSDAPVIAEVEIIATTQVPIVYAIAIPTTLVDADHEYLLTASIVVDDAPLYVTTDSVTIDVGEPTQTIDLQLVRPTGTTGG